MGFNQTEYDFSVPVDAPPGTKVGTAWISMPLSVITLEDGTLAPFHLNGIYASFNGLTTEFDGTRWSIREDYFYLEIYFANKHQDVVEGSGDANLLNLTLDDVNSCGNEHILIPIDIYTQSAIFAIGTYYFSVTITFTINDKSVHVSTTLSMDVNYGKYVQNYFLDHNLLD